MCMYLMKRCEMTISCEIVPHVRDSPTGDGAEVDHVTMLLKI